MPFKINETITVKNPANKRTGIMVIPAEEFDPKVHTKVKAKLKEEPAPEGDDKTEGTADE